MTMIIKKIIATALILVTINSLTGCAAFRDYRANKQQCQTSKVLYTDLTKSAATRSYLLPSGTDCTEYLQ